MAATPAQIHANRQNAVRSTGPKSVEGKETARRNALKHGLTGGGVVIPGEDEQEVTIREAAFRAQLVDEGDALGGALVRQMAIASIRVERAFRCETALAAERMRKAADLFDDERLTRVQTILGEIELDPVTVRRRLLAAPEGVDALIDRLRALRVQTDTTRMIAWDEGEGKELDQILGHRPGQAPLSRVALLTRGIAYDHWVGIDPAEFAELDSPTRLHWAVGEVRKVIDDEIVALEVHRANLDTTRRDLDRAEAGERTLLDLDKDGTALRRYAGAAERTMLKVLQELRLARAEAQERTLAAVPTPGPIPVSRAEVIRAGVTEPPVHSEVGGELGSFCPEPRGGSRPGSRGAVDPVGADLGGSIASFAVGRGPDRGGAMRS